MLDSFTRACFLLALGGALAAQVPVPGATSVAETPEEVRWLGTTPFVEGQLIVRFEAGADPFAALADATPGRYFVDSQLMRSLDLYLVRITDGTPVYDAVRELRPNPAIRYANPDHLVENRQTLPNDPNFGSEWGKHNTGQSGGKPDADIDAPEAWDLGTGSRQFTVAIVDGGCQINHPDLVNNIYVNQAEANGTPGVDDDGNGYVDDVNGWNAYNSTGNIPSDFHGTHVSGIAGAEGNNGIGVAGVNWDVTIMPVAGSSSITSTVLRAYGYCEAQKTLWLSSGGTKGANVVATNSSFGIDFADCNAAPYTQWNDAYNSMGSVGILSAAATANLNINIDTSGDVPTGCPSEYLVAVTNTTRNDTKASAGYGATSIDLGAPGTSIMSTVPTSGYGLLSGTSMATPQVAGAIAFLHSVAGGAFATLRQNDPAFAALEVKRILLENVDVISALNGITVSNGRLNLNRSALEISTYSGGSVVTFGNGLDGANIGTLTYGSGNPVQGSSVVLNVGSLPNSLGGVVVFSPQIAVVQALGGTLLVDLSQVAATLPFTLAAGSGQLTVPLPPGTAGFVGYGQGGALDATQSAGFAFTNGVTITIGM